MVTDGLKKLGLTLTLLLGLRYVRLVNVNQVLVLEALRGVLAQLLVQLRGPCLKSELF